MKHLKHLIPPLVLYAAKAFILAEANPFNWSQAQREDLVTYTVFGYAFFWLALYMYNNNKESS